jgi:hypothetical protein
VCAKKRIFVYKLDSFVGMNRYMLKNDMQGIFVADNNIILGPFRLAGLDCGQWGTTFKGMDFSPAHSHTAYVV